MQITGEKALTNISENGYYSAIYVLEDGTEIALDELFAGLDEHIQDDTFMHLEVQINGGIEEDGTTLSLETNVINLPLRYTNQLKKLILTEKEDNDVYLYMIVENPNVSQSRLKISLASSVAAYLDESDSVKSKISNWFDEQLAHIVTVQQELEKEETAMETKE